MKFAEIRIDVIIREVKKKGGGVRDSIKYVFLHLSLNSRFILQSQLDIIYNDQSLITLPTVWDLLTHTTIITKCDISSFRPQFSVSSPFCHNHTVVMIDFFFLCNHSHTIKRCFCILTEKRRCQNYCKFSGSIQIQASLYMWYKQH